MVIRLPPLTSIPDRRVELMKPADAQTAAEIQIPWLEMRRQIHFLRRSVGHPDQIHDIPGADHEVPGDVLHQK